MGVVEEIPKTDRLKQGAGKRRAKKKNIIKKRSPARRSGTTTIGNFDTDLKTRQKMERVN